MTETSEVLLTGYHCLLSENTILLVVPFMVPFNLITFKLNTNELFIFDVYNVWWQGRNSIIHVLDKWHHILHYTDVVQSSTQLDDSEQHKIFECGP